MVGIRKRIVRKNRRICDNRSVAVVVELRHVLAECYTFRSRLRTNVPHACPHAQILFDYKKECSSQSAATASSMYSLSRQVPLI